MSSNTSIVRARLIFDNEKILYNFLQIKDPLTLIKIFPNLKSIQNKINENTIAFLIANEAWQTKNHYHRQFSISVLYNFLENQKIMTELENQFNFKINKDFYEMVSSNPLGSSLETINEKPIYRRIIKSCGNIIFSKFFCR